MILALCHFHTFPILFTIVLPRGKNLSIGGKSNWVELGINSSPPQYLVVYSSKISI